MKPISNSQPELSNTTPSSLLSQSLQQLSILKLKNKLPFWFNIGMVIGISSSAIAFSWSWQQLRLSLPQTVSDLSSYVRPDTLTIKAEDGTVLQEIGAVTHEKVKLAEVPQILTQALIASEDRRFYDHDGIDFLGISRAAVSNVLAGSVVEGGSTITQQLSRMVYLNQQRTIWRKLQEVIIASQIEGRFNKQEILECYLNSVYFGAGAYGVADAAWVYFGKSLNELTLSEVATLVGIVPAPSLYSPINNPELAQQRRNIVLNKMAQQGLIDGKTVQAAIASPLTLKPHQLKRFQRFAPYFTDYIQKQLPQYVSPDILHAGGVVVETTLNYQWQQAAEDKINEALDRYGKWQTFQQAALVSLDPRTGGIKAMVGGRDFGNNQFNRVTQAQRQPGSTFKPFVYTAAIAAGFSPYKSYLDSEYMVDGYQPKNYGDKYRHREVSLYDALAASINVVALRTLIDVGWEPTIEIAKKMGIQSELVPTYSLALGAWEVNLLELTNAYATLANQGVYQAGYGIERIRDRYGKIIYEAKPQPQTAIDQDTAATMTWMLQGVVNSGTGIPAQIGRPVAGKTGTSDKARDLWFIGYIPQVTTGIWLGNDNNQATHGTSAIAAEIWRKFMLEVVKDLPVENFPSRSVTSKKPSIKAEPVKPKSSFYLEQTPSRSIYDRSEVRSHDDAPRRTSIFERLNKLKKIPNYPMTEEGNDWLLERLGRLGR
ncbi:penicillin-binding protein, 1A family [Stanieria cyanosphaera PCC 7437]|uniref:Penicillin-binding protein, 1A family n=1 Tax=Stanieria cyanosphaera (strain ATCC 29371 / PCC 7437) TaxID=111780 RepID=K9XYW1_STAC7|nr:PBP1A family penicillin-binding protein [Stanieria cyanosphaera]AFZ36862.1 penicillin-binding protein, 1A family [Stanieria cyanosphaera PCC 7437]